MEIVNGKSKTRVPAYLAILVILLAVSLGVYWYSWQKINNDVDSSEQSIASGMSVSKKPASPKDQLILLLQAREKGGKYGEWPLGTVSLSEKRGNPFLPKINK